MPEKRKPCRFVESTTATINTTVFQLEKTFDFGQSDATITLLGNVVLSRFKFIVIAQALGQLNADFKGGDPQSKFIHCVAWELALALEEDGYLYIPVSTPGWRIQANSLPRLDDLSVEPEITFLSLSSQ